MPPHRPPEDRHPETAIQNSTSALPIQASAIPSRAPTILNAGSAIPLQVLPILLSVPALPDSALPIPTSAQPFPNQETVIPIGQSAAFAGMICGICTIDDLVARMTDLYKVLIPCCARLSSNSSTTVRSLNWAMHRHEQSGRSRARNPNGFGPASASVNDEDSGPWLLATVGGGEPGIRWRCQSPCSQRSSRETGKQMCRDVISIETPYR